MDHPRHFSKCWQNRFHQVGMERMGHLERNDLRPEFFQPAADRFNFGRGGPI